MDPGYPLILSAIRFLTLLRFGLSNRDLLIRVGMFVSGPKGNPILGLTRAEPVYPAFDQGLLRGCCLTLRSVTRAAPKPLFHLHEPQVSAIKDGNDIVKCGAGHRHRFHSAFE
jgi:hypothetical protein